MNYNIIDFNNTINNFDSGSGLKTEDNDDDESNDRKIANYIALSFLICFASIIVFCIILILCSELCRNAGRINYYISDTYSFNSYNSNFSNQNQTSISNTRQEVNEKITDKVSRYFNNIINPIYDDNLDKCAICLEEIDYLNKDDEPCTLNCYHTYHKRCITEYVLYNAVNGSDVNCPLCRKEIHIV